MIFSACIDDSGSEGKIKNDYFILGGFYAPNFVWKRFAYEWATLLTDPPSIEYFKIKEAVRLQDQFMGFTPGERDQKVRSLLSLITRHRLLGIVAVMPYQQFEQSRIPKIPERDSKSPYVSLLLDVVLGISAKHMKITDNQAKVQFLCDDQSKLGETADDWYRQFHAVLPEKIANRMAPRVVFETDQEFNPIQAADTIAWLTRRCFHAKLDSIKIPIEIITDCLNGVKLIHGTLWTRERLAMIEATVDRIVPEIRMIEAQFKAGEDPVRKMFNFGELKAVPLTQFRSFREVLEWSNSRYEH
jgi:hypothetical protein